MLRYTLFGVLLLLLLTASAGAHMAQSGWVYSARCCSGKDCRPLSKEEEPKPTPSGWFILQTGETIPYRDSKIQLSQDWMFHLCMVKPANKPPYTRCLYTPDQSS